MKTSVEPTLVSVSSPTFIVLEKRPTATTSPEVVVPTDSPESVAVPPKP